MNVYTCSRIELKREAVETAIMHTLNNNPAIFRRLFDCGSLGTVRIWWERGRWHTRWYDDIISVTEMPGAMGHACEIYGMWKRQRAWVRQQRRISEEVQ